MKTKAFLAAALAVALLAMQSEGHAAATAGTKFFDSSTKQWVTFGPAARQRHNPVPREIVDYAGPHGADTIVVNTAERRLYYVLGNGKAIRYGVGVGREGFQWAGTHRITRKAEWPGWTPPPQMRKRQPGLPLYMEGGPANPLGARALYIGSTLYRIHGSNEPWTIGQAVSSGCVRMTNDDVTDLYDKVKVGTRVVVLR
ncbi:L,D-transpeptidase [Faunimonas sp. B44]|uniref:L,D-transpeptidase n=1 Tax=Faunimonas sp. B44 TaxID=3461493 RepID=UPI004044F5A8